MQQGALALRQRHLRRGQGAWATLCREGAAGAVAAAGAAGSARQGTPLSRLTPSLAMMAAGSGRLQREKR